MTASDVRLRPGPTIEHIAPGAQTPGDLGHLLCRSALPVLTGRLQGSAVLAQVATGAGECVQVFETCGRGLVLGRVSVGFKPGDGGLAVLANLVDSLGELRSIPRR